MAKKQKLQNKPALLLYFFGHFFFIRYCKKHYNITTTGEKPKGPALILSNHTSNEDYKFIICAAAPRRVTFVATYHWFTFKKLKFWLKIIGAISKYQFTSDLQSMKKIRYAVQENKSLVFIAPEGTIYANGKLGYISPSTAKFIKFLKVPVYASKIEGAGLGAAKWSARKHDINHVNVDTHLLFTAEETQTLTKEEIMQRLNSALAYDDFEYQKNNNVTSNDKDLAEGFETMFYKCPVCGSEFTLTTGGNTISCSHCHAEAEIQSNFRFKWKGEKQYFDNYIQWYDWQFDEIKKLVASPDFKLEEEVDYGIDKPGIDNYVKVGHGTMTFSHGGWTYKGTKEGQEVEEHDETREVFLATLKTGLHFELPFKYDHCRVFYPANGLTSMKWHLASRAMSELNGY